MTAVYVGVDGKRGELKVSWVSQGWATHAFAAFSSYKGTLSELHLMEITLEAVWSLDGVGRAMCESVYVSVLMHRCVLGE